MDQDFTIAVRPENMPFGFEIGAAFWVLEKLTIADRSDSAVLVVDRLLPVLQPYNAEASLREAYARRHQEALVLGPAMRQRIRHSLQHGAVRQTLRCKIYRPGNATHMSSFLWRCSVKSCPR
jgi:hypothetical protein